MCEYFGYRVEKLVRTRIMNIELGELQEGTYRNVTAEEYANLQKLIKNSSNTTVKPEVRQKNIGNRKEKKNDTTGTNRRIKKDNRIS